MLLIIYHRLENNLKQIRALIGSYNSIETQNYHELWKHSPAARIPTAFLVLPNFRLCFYISIEIRYMFSFS